jgi:hypothetical protein
MTQRTTTQHGYPILRRKASANGGEIVIAKLDHNRAHPFVVWRMDDQGICEGGDYCATEDEAGRAFCLRC